jgi:radical SAM protein (TIGR01212 family)
MSSTDSKLRAIPPADWRLAGLRYCELNFFYRRRFGGKVWKLSLDAGCNCPNRDGTLATSGCVFCDIPSFSPSRRGPRQPLSTQLSEGSKRLKDRHAAERFIAYFQPATNTYGPLDVLRDTFQEAANYPGVVGLAIGTRPDCVDDAVLDMLANVAQSTWLLVEFGVQTIHDRTLNLLNRGHHFDAFRDAYQRAKVRNLDVGVHVILGLLGESGADMLATARELAQFRLHSIKLHNLYAVRGTRLAEQVTAGEVQLPGFDEHVGHVVDFLEETPGDCVVDRISGDAPAEYLLGPDWCRNKGAIRAAVDAEFRRRGTWQGCKVSLQQ